MTVCFSKQARLGAIFKRNNGRFDWWPLLSQMGGNSSRWNIPELSVRAGSIGTAALSKDGRRGLQSLLKDKTRLPLSGPPGFEVASSTSG